MLLLISVVAAAAAAAAAAPAPAPAAAVAAAVAAAAVAAPAFVVVADCDASTPAMREVRSRCIQLKLLLLSVFFFVLRSLSSVAGLFPNSEQAGARRQSIGPHNRVQQFRDGHN